MSKKDGDTSKKGSETSDESDQLIVLEGPIVMLALGATIAFVISIGVWMIFSMVSNTDHIGTQEQLAVLYHEHPTPMSYTQNHSDALIDASSGELKNKLRYIKKYKPDLYSDIHASWEMNQDMRLQNPFEAAKDIEDDWDRCYSVAFDGHWWC